MKIEIDRDRCVAAGTCVLSAPNHFDQDDDGIVILLAEAAAPDQESVVEDAALRCPASAITLT